MSPVSATAKPAPTGRVNAMFLPTAPVANFLAPLRIAVPLGSFLAPAQVNPEYP